MIMTFLCSIEMGWNTRLHEDIYPSLAAECRGLGSVHSSNILDRWKLAQMSFRTVLESFTDTRTWLTAIWDWGIWRHKQRISTMASISGLDIWQPHNRRAHAAIAPRVKKETNAIYRNASDPCPIYPTHHSIGWPWLLPPGSSMTLEWSPDGILEAN